MALSLKEALVTLPQSDTSGANSSKRFSFQKNWALAELLEYHLADRNYVFAFEFHDDVLILDSEDDPKKIKFVQVKTDTTGKKWSITRLTNIKKPKKPEVKTLSIVGKLYENQTKFAGHSSELRFVTNAFFSFASIPGRIHALKLKPDEQSKISSKVKEELGLEDNIDLGCLYFEQTELSVDGHEEHLKGKLHSFFEKVFGDDHQVPVGQWYRSLTDEIKLKNDYPPEKITDFDSLIRNKCITRSEVDRFVSRVRGTQSTNSYWPDVKKQLSDESVGFKRIQKIERSWKQYNADRLNYENISLKNLEEEISTCLQLINVSDNILLTELVQVINEKLKLKLYAYTALFDEDYITSIILWNYCEQ